MMVMMMIMIVLIDNNNKIRHSSAFPKSEVLLSEESSLDFWICFVDFLIF